MRCAGVKSVNDIDSIGWVAGGCKLKSPVMVIPSDHGSRSRGWSLQPQHRRRNKKSSSCSFTNKPITCTQLDFHDISKKIGLTFMLKLLSSKYNSCLVGRVRGFMWNDNRFSFHCKAKFWRWHWWPIMHMRFNAKTHNIKFARNKRYIAFTFPRVHIKNSCATHTHTVQR